MSSAAEHVTDQVDRFVVDTVGVEDVVLVSADGAVLAASADLPDSVADQFGPVTAALLSLGRASARCLAQHRADRVVVDLDELRVLLVGVTDIVAVAVIARVDADLDLLTDRTRQLVDVLRPRLATGSTSPIQTPAIPASAAAAQ
ncbi:MAG: roadblock/LC7 domain-containing protein [Actinomycetota bacterium]